MRRTLAQAAAALTAALMISSPLEAADITLLNAHPEGCAALLTGRIQAGDTDRLNTLVGGADPSAQRRFLNTNVRLCLDSPGGSFIEGLALARQLRQDGIGTHVPADAACLSACALAFLGGSALSAEDAIVHRFQRSMHATARLGFHAPQLEIDAGDFTEAEIKSAFALALRAAAMIFTRLEELGISRAFALAFFDVPVELFYEIDTPERVQEANLRVTGTAPLPQRIAPDRIAEICTLAFARFDASLYDDPDIYTSVVRTDVMDMPAQSPLAQHSAYLMATTAEGTLMWDACEIEWQPRGQDVFGPRLRVSHHVLTDFDFLDFRDPDLPPRDSVIAQLDTPAQNMTQLSPLLATPAGTRIAALASPDRPAFDGLVAATCAPVRRGYAVWRVQNFTNLRDRPGFEGTVLQEVRKDARVSPLSWRLEDTAILNAACRATCQPAERGSITSDDLWKIEACRDSGDVWWQVRTAEGTTGWLSARFLKP